MSRRLALVALAALALTLPSGAEFFSKKYDFVQERLIELNQKAGDVTIQDVQFRFPGYVGPRKLEIQGRNQAEIHVKNYGKEELLISLAIALFDSEGNLVGCGTAGSKLAVTAPGDEESFDVTFDYVKGRLATAKTFQLTIETEKAR
jgi:hypothetical protein